MVKLVVPAKKTGEFDLAVAAVDTNSGKLLSPIRYFSVSVRVKAKADEEASPQTSALISRGDQLMAFGDLSAAREFYLRAHQLGALPTILLQIGMTYDPVVYEANGVAGLKLDVHLALEYYRQADRAGVAAASDAITRLEAWIKSSVFGGLPAHRF